MDEDYFCLLVVKRFRKEALEEDDDLQLEVEYGKELAKAHLLLTLLLHSAKWRQLYHVDI
jgi:hypothetical protein